MCMRCMWSDQCGKTEPCSHFEPIDLESHLEKQYVDELILREYKADLTAIEQDNLYRE